MGQSHWNDVYGRNVTVGRAECGRLDALRPDRACLQLELGHGLELHSGRYRGP
jgi:hypothetical protein